MSRNGTGNYSVPNTFVSGTTITAADHNANWSDIGSEMSNSLALDGQSSMTGQLKAASGTVSLPGVAFSADLDTGLYRIGANNLGLAVGGTKIVDVSSTGISITGTLAATGLFSVGDGTVSAPGLAFASDTDSGLYRIGANNVGVAVNGAKALDIGTVGLAVTGTLSSTGALTVTSGGLTVTAGGLTVTAGGLTVTAGSVALPAASISDATLVAPGAMRLIQTQVASSSTTLDFTTGLDDTYDHYMLVFSSLKPATDDVQLQLLVGTGAGPTYQTSGYAWSATIHTAGTASNAGSTSDTKIGLSISGGGTDGVGNASGKNISGIAKFANPEASDYCVVTYHMGYIRAVNATSVSVAGVGNYTNAGAITGLRVKFSSGNIASGRVTLYGLKKS